ncbi:MAG: helix-turn-helix domain-containing protein [Actinomycetota bacterium]|nr:helix-turn-helix domain-containing protein [Actinomycetota bacterium]
MGRDLSDVLCQSGLETIVDDGEVTIWAPPPPSDEAPSEKSEVQPLPLLVDIASAAARLGVSRSTLYRLIEAGQLDVVHVGRSVRVPTAALEDLVDGLRRRPKGGDRQRAGGHRSVVGSGGGDEALAGGAGLGSHPAPAG